MTVTDPGLPPRTRLAAAVQILVRCATGVAVPAHRRAGTGRGATRRSGAVAADPDRSTGLPGVGTGKPACRSPARAHLTSDRRCRPRRITHRAMRFRHRPGRRRPQRRRGRCASPQRQERRLPAPAHVTRGPLRLPQARMPGAVGRGVAAGRRGPPVHRPAKATAPPFPRPGRHRARALARHHDTLPPPGTHTPASLIFNLCGGAVGWSASSCGMWWCSSCRVCGRRGVGWAGCSFGRVVVRVRGA